jgi:hypothetical protein
VYYTLEIFSLSLLLLLLLLFCCLALDSFVGKETQRASELHSSDPSARNLLFLFKKQNENIFVFRFTASGKREENYGLEREKKYILEDADVPVPQVRHRRV